MASPWQELEIEPTGDVLAIRRAYRARLNRTRPEEAARLQAAYEAAIAALPLPPAPGPAVDTAQADDVMAAIAERKALKAATLIANGRAQSTLTLRQDIEAIEGLLGLLTTDRGVPHDEIVGAAAMLGWLHQGELPAGAAFAPLRARLAAETWFGSVRDTARRRRPFSARTAAARSLLGQRPSILWRFFPPRSALAALLSELDGQRGWIEHRLDAACIENAKRIVGSAR